MELYERFLAAASENQFDDLRDHFVRGGYSAFRRFLNRLKDRIQSFADGQEADVRALVAKARRAVPDPGAISPSWTDVWDRLERMIGDKCKALAAVPPEERGGEWQILIDNPYVNREVACYPGLAFKDAVYIYARFRGELENNEYIRLQKIVTHLTEFGGDPG